MAQVLTDKTKATLTEYLSQVRTLPNESAKTHRFAALIGELFPGSSAVPQFAAGVEKLVRIETPTGKKKGFIDSYYGNAVIEFEKSLKATGKVAEQQLREYVAGVWAGESKPPRPLVAIASDGIVWRTYRPTLSGKGTPKTEIVTLELVREFTLSDGTLGEFWLWLTSLLFRPSSIRPTADQFRQDFGAKSPAFWDAREAIGRAWLASREAKEPRLAFDTWQKYLTYTYGSLPDAGPGTEHLSGIEALFVKHTYLASVARLLIWASFSGGKTKDDLRTVAAKVLSGEFFQAQRLANLVDDDFFQWVRRPKAEAILAPVWERILDQMLTYDLAHLGEDVLKGVYQELVDPGDRHDLGEYYTPDWLCDRIVEELLPAKGVVSVLDPTCGSGSFLRATITHLLRAHPGGSDGDRLHAVLDHVVGIDIHPLAVTISRATYVLALRGLVRAAKRPIHIPVYLADSLFLPAEVDQGDLLLKGGLGFKVRFGDREVIMPEGFVKAPDLFDQSIETCTRVAVNNAASKSESPKTLRATLAKTVPSLFHRKDHEDIFNALWKFTVGLAGLIKAEKNSIWGFIVRNAYRPAMLRGRFDYVVGNPPWLSYRYIADPDYQEEIKERAINEYRIAPTSKKLITQMELATVFLAHSLQWFGSDEARLGFVMPRSVLTADQHVNLRARTYKALFELKGYWDLWDVEPLFNVPACVLFAQRSPSKGSINDRLPVVEWKGHLPTRDVSWGVAKDRLTSTKATGRVIFMGNRTAFSTESGQSKPNKQSRYAEKFRQGATIVPRSFYFVRVDGLKAPPDPDATYWAETDPEQAEDAKPPYRDVKMSGNVEGRFLFCTALSRHLLPFVLLPPATIVLPAERGVNLLSLRDVDELRREGNLEFAGWMKKAEAIWKKHRKDKSAKQTVYQRLDYQKELTSQDLSTRHLVVYNAAGTNLVAAYVDRKSLPLMFVVEHKLYWASFDTQAEAEYLVAILNCEAVNEAIKPFQSVGLMGERDIEKKVLELPIPRYSTKDDAHNTLARLSAEARTQASGLISSPKFPTSLSRRRGWLRTELGSLLTQINTIVGDLLEAAAQK